MQEQTTSNRRDGFRAVIVILGELDDAASDRITEQVEALVRAGATDLEFDLSPCSRIVGHGAFCLTSAYKRMAGRARVVAVSPGARVQLDIHRLTALLMDEAPATPVPVVASSVTATLRPAWVPA